VTVTDSSLPDLVAGTVLQNPTDADVGSPVSFDVGIKNQGAASTGTGFTNLWEISSTNSPANFNAIAYRNNTFHDSTLASGVIATSSLSGFTFQQSDYNVSPTWYIRACADTDSNNAGTITESYENNNCSTTWTKINLHPVTTKVVTCGSDANVQSNTAPTDPGLCTGGTASAVTGPDSNNLWNWSCTASAGYSGGPVSCTAPYPGTNCQGSCCGNSCGGGSLSCNAYEGSGTSGNKITNSGQQEQEPATITYQAVPGSGVSGPYTFTDESGQHVVSSGTTYTVTYPSGDDGLKPVSISAASPANTTATCTSVTAYHVVPPACSGPVVKPTISTPTPRVVPGDSVVLNWTQGSGKSCVVTGPNGYNEPVSNSCGSNSSGSLPASGDPPITITKPSIFMIECDSDINLSDSVTISVLPNFQEF
jgi:hypothetical protein